VPLENVVKESVVENKTDEMLKNITTYLLVLLVSVVSLSGQNDKEDLYIVDTTFSNITWNCGPHYGCINFDTGYINVVDDKVVNGKFIADLSSLYVEDIEHELLRLTLANVIKSHEFFDVHNFPHFVFTIDTLEELDTNEFNISGQLILKEKILPINFNCEIDIRNDSIYVYSDYIIIDRTMWDINYLSKRFDPEGKEQMYVPDKIEFMVQIYANKSKKKQVKK